MEIYIVATTRELNSNKVIGYLAYDLDERKSMEVSKASMIEAVLAGRAKIHNATILRNSGSRTMYSNSTMKGTRYSLDILSYYYKNDPYTIYNRGLLVLKQQKDNKWCIISVSNANTVNCAEVTTNILNDYIMQGKIINYDTEKRDVLAAKNISNVEVATNIATEVTNPRLAELTKRALDNDDIWDMNTFEEFMKLKGWDYTIRNNKLVALDNRCDIIHIPVEITEIGRVIMGKSINHTIKKIIIGPKVRELTSLAETQYDKSNPVYIEVEEVYFQKEDRSSRKYYENEIYIGKFTDNLHITRALNMPYGFTTISKLYNNCIIEPQIVLSNQCNNTEYKLLSSFTNTVFKQDKLILENISEISDCFSKSTGFREVYIRKAETVYAITMSFNHIATLNKVNFNEMTNLYNLRYSFIDCGFTQVDLSNCKLLCNLTNEPFNNCVHLREIKLPSNIITFDLNNFSGTCIKYLEIDMHKAKQYNLSNVKTDMQIRMFSSSEDKTLHIDKKFFDPIYCGNGDRVGLLTRIKNGEDMLSNVTLDINVILEEEAFDNILKMTSTNNQRLFSKVIKIEEAAFSRSHIKIFDSADLSNIDTIPSNCFKSSDTETVVLDKNIIAVGQNAFKKVTNLEIIIASENLKKISKSAFSDIKSTNIVRVYAVKGSYAADFFKCIANFVVIEVDSVEEARDIVFGDKIRSDEKLNKFRMVWGTNAKYNWVFEEPYIHNIGNIAKVLIAIDSKEATNNFTYTSPKMLNVKLEDIPSMCNEFDVDIHKDESIDNQLDVSDKFIMLSNIVVEFCEPYVELFNTNINERIESGDIIINSSEILLADKDKAIIKYGLTTKRVRCKLDMICIVDSGIIVYAGVVNTELNVKLTMKHISSREYYHINKFSPYYNKLLSFDVKKPLSTLLNTGDIICQGSTSESRGKGRIETKVIISGAEFAEYEDVTLNMLMYFLGNTFYLGAYLEELPKAKQAIPYGIFVDSRSKTVFICKLLLNTEYNNYLVGVTITEKIEFSDIKELHKLIDERLCKLEDRYNTRDKFKIAKKVILYGSRIDIEAKKDMSYYDLDRNNDLAVLADKVYKNSYKSLNDNIPEEFMQELFNSSLMKTAGCSFNEIKDDDEYVGIKTYTYKNKYIQIYSYKDGYVMGIIDKKTKMSDRNVLKFSLLKLDSMLDMLFKMGYILNHNDFRIIPVSNRKISEDYVIKIYDIKEEYKENSFNIFIGIDKLSGYSHILLDCGNNKVISILRFNNIIDAYDVLTDYVLGQYITEEVLSCILNNKTNSPDTGFNKIRNLVIDGYNLLLATRDNAGVIKESVLRKVCKQPPESAMPDIFIK